MERQECEMVLKHDDDIKQLLINNSRIDNQLANLCERLDAQTSAITRLVTTLIIGMAGTITTIILRAI